MPDIRDARILVIGGGGFVGSHVVDQLTLQPVAEIVALDRGGRAVSNLTRALTDDRVRFVEGSVTDLDLLRELMRQSDYAFNLAALWLYECVQEPRAALDVNVVGTYNVVETAYEAGVKKVVFSSSASVYGEPLFTPMTEDHPFNNRSMYGATKIAGEQFFRAFHEQYGLDYVGLRYMNVYGPRMASKGPYVGVMVKVLDRIEAGMPPIIAGDGSQSFDFVHVDDVARANILALLSDATDEMFNIGTGQETTINELVRLLLEIIGSDLEPEYLPNQQMFVTRRIGTVDKAERMLGFRASTPLAEGLRSFVDWRRRLADERARAGSDTPHV